MNLTPANKIDPNEQQHIFPVVKVVEGPTWSPTSSQGSQYINPERDQDLSQSITYSPLLPTSTSSSLHFVAKNGDTKITKISDNVVTSDTNLDFSTVENLKSLSSEKQTSSLKESEKDRIVIKRPKKFIPPRKLTRKEIQEEFDEQDRQLYKSDLSESDLSKYLEQRLNRPSVKQVQNSKHLAFVRRTDDGVEVIPAKPEPLKKTPFRRNLSTNSNIDMSIFSDKNAKRFNEFLNSEERDVKRFKFNLDSQSQTGRDFHFQPETISDYMAGLDNLFRGQNEDNFHSLSTITPVGYYAENRDDMNDIVNKYLSSGSSSHDVSIFETCSLNENDLVL